MRLAYQFESARHILAGMAAGDLEMLTTACRRVQQAQAALLTAAAAEMRRCTTACRGLCCRNVQLDAVIGLWDFLYILVLSHELAPRIEECLQQETPFFSADCIFLSDGVGPCIFAPDIRPEVCITAFCTDDRPVKHEIDRVKRTYLKMIWFVRLARANARMRHLIQAVKRT